MPSWLSAHSTESWSEDCVVSSFESQLHLLDSGLEFHKALLHRAAEVKQDNGALELLLHCLPLAAGQACERIYVDVDAPELAQTIYHGFNGR